MASRPTGRMLVPSGWAARWSQARRDLRMIGQGLRGRHPAPFQERPKRHVATPAAANPLLLPRALRVARVVRETDDAVTLWLTDPTGAAIVFAAGQFFTLLLTVGGVPLRRAYSACSSDRDRTIVGLTVKRVPDGVVSAFVNDQIRAGDRVFVLGPSGSFTLPPEPAHASPRRLVFVGGGSGITPLMSLARTVLATEPNATIALIYGNRGVRDIIFRDALDELAVEHPLRFTVRYVLSDPPAGWTGGVGMLDAATLAAELENVALSDAEVFVCGPEGMMTAARDALAAAGVPTERIRQERFTAPHLREAKSSARTLPSASLTVRAKGADHALGANAGRTVLESGLAAGLAMPFSCAMGGCGACKVKVLSGSVQMEEPNCLTPDERAEGFVLACVGCPTNDTIVELP